MTSAAPVFLLIYGEGGHQAEMESLLESLRHETPELALVSMGKKHLAIPVVSHYRVEDVRHKHSRWQNLLLTAPRLLRSLMVTVKILYRHRVSGVISTGPGLCILPMMLCRLMGIRTVFIETSCRFMSRSMTGRIMYRVAERFLVQNESLIALYPNGEYCGRL